MDAATTAELIHEVATKAENRIRTARDERTDGLIEDKITDLMNFLTHSIRSEKDPGALVSHMKEATRGWIAFYKRKGALSHDVEEWFEDAVDQILKEDIETIVKGRKGS
ncbi:hypothetical protein HK104_010850 [Borealophlyctis nickersoniae]|nr:hypothetical protein HK104_010850 [Borealophlyctis nickersoniae]